MIRTSNGSQSATTRSWSSHGMSEINPRHPLECSNATRWPLGAEEHSEDGRLSWFAGVCFAPNPIAGGARGRASPFAWTRWSSPGS